eukprot:scaffold2627_cov122-Skeletonema_marinoi.AAC.4
MGLGRETGLQEQELERADANKPEAESPLEGTVVTDSILLEGIGLSNDLESCCCFAELVLKNKADPA